MTTRLESAGWTIIRAADTASGEHGPDVVATLGSRRLTVQVKGYPQPTYARGARAGEPKKWHPASQARTYFGTSIHVALVIRDGMPGTEVALALPDVPGYRGLLDQVHRSLAELNGRVFLVGKDGSVREWDERTEGWWIRRWETLRASTLASTDRSARRGSVFARNAIGEECGYYPIWCIDDL